MLIFAIIKVFEISNNKSIDHSSLRNSRSCSVNNIIMDVSSFSDSKRTDMFLIEVLQCKWSKLY